MNTFICTPLSFIYFYLFFTLLLHLSPTTHCVDPYYELCAPETHCGQHLIRYPFFINGRKSSCGFPGFVINCTNEFPVLRLRGNSYIIDQIFYNNHSVRVYNAALSDERPGCFPENIRNLSLVGNSKFGFFNQLPEVVLLANCSTNLSNDLVSRRRVECGGAWDLAMVPGDEELGDALEECRVNVEAPVEDDGVGGRAWELMRRGFMLNWTAANCSDCQLSGGLCGFDYASFRAMCFCTDRPHFRRCQPNKSHLKVILATVIPGGFITSCMLLYIIWRRHKWNDVTFLLSRNTSSDPSSNDDLEGGSLYFGVPVFSYRELEEATKSFDPSKELGDGGFGTVYHGKLRDGREVAVKRLYEHNYKRVEQFMNEVQILTRMRHRNLVLLYGCTSRRSRELLLVYEYIPNGTVADHLHGDRVKTGSLSWPIRMNIAIETASALAYLHASDIIHRDVKTNNILLDTNFCVKVADFGLSRLFPNDVTHVSTAPQGTPGYVDPEYHQCYQLTDKSDVYSFGVVLIELISSMPAVDISRHRDEINLANLAINKIQKSAFHELIDPSLGFESDDDVERMTTSVAELAFRCLQLEKEMRPKMEEVLQALKGIKGVDDEYKIEKTEEGEDSVSKNVRPPPSPESDDVVLLKNCKVPPSPDTVTAKWVSSSSSSTIPITSG